MSEPLFIYSKDGVIKCLTMQESLDMEPFIKGQWKHTATINPAKWIEAVVNNRDGLELIKEVKGGPQ